MKKDLCFEVRAASANRMHSAALLRNWSKLGKFTSISIHMGTDRAYRQKVVISRLPQALSRIVATYSSRNASPPRRQTNWKSRDR